MPDYFELFAMPPPLFSLCATLFAAIISLPLFRHFRCCRYFRHYFTLIFSPLFRR